MKYLRLTHPFPQLILLRWQLIPMEGCLKVEADQFIHRWDQVQRRTRHLIQPKRHLLRSVISYNDANLKLTGSVSSVHSIRPLLSASINERIYRFKSFDFFFISTSDPSCEAFQFFVDFLSHPMLFYFLFREKSIKREKK